MILELRLLNKISKILMLQEKVSELQLAADSAAHLKDEIDALSESAEKQNLKYEEEIKNSTVWKNQSEMYKKQAADYQQKLDEEIQRTDRASYQMKNLESKYSALLSEKDRLVKERDSLREEYEEFKLGKQIDKDNGADVARELAPTEMKERLCFLEKENVTLRSAGQDVVSKQALLDDALNRIEKLTEQNRNINQKVLELETQLQEQQRVQLDDYTENTIKEYKQKVASLLETLHTKDNELQTIQAKYARNLERLEKLLKHSSRKLKGMIL
ncbi:hypothetical protein FQR65_LT13410 [Abscondita terminalis]|nr:hypothetical protein FQR65_LT13410 [Abscondita terminalis]